MTNWHDVATTAVLTEGEREVLELEDYRILVTNIDGTYLAVESMCSHAMFDLDEGEVVEGCQIICPLHGAHFCLRTGAALSPPAYEPIKTFPTRVVDGMVQVSDEPME